MIKVVTVSRQYGAGGHLFAKLLAKELNVPLYDRQLIHVAAAQLLAGNGVLTKEELIKIEAEVPPLGLNFMEFFNFGIRGSKPLNTQIFEAESAVIAKLYDQERCVILGRCADFVLHDKADVLKVFVHASDPWRQQYALDHYTGKPLFMLKDEDKKRAAYYSHYTRQTFGDPDNFDVVLKADSAATGDLARAMAAYVKSFDQARAAS